MSILANHSETQRSQGPNRSVTLFEGLLSRHGGLVLASLLIPLLLLGESLYRNMTEENTGSCAVEHEHVFEGAVFPVLSNKAGTPCQTNCDNSAGSGQLIACAKKAL